APIPDAMAELQSEPRELWVPHAFNQTPYPEFAWILPNLAPTELGQRGVASPDIEIHFEQASVRARDNLLKHRPEAGRQDFLEPIRQIFGRLHLKPLVGSTEPFTPEMAIIWLDEQWIFHLVLQVLHIHHSLRIEGPRVWNPSLLGKLVLLPLVR